MCGRYSMSASTADLMAFFDARDERGGVVSESWNVAPTQAVTIVVERPDEAGEEPVRQLRAARWGLVPFWSETGTPNARAINARAETVAEKPSFRAAAKSRRAIVPADGFYEWTGEKGNKTPYFLHDPDTKILSFGGLYEFWRDDKGDDWLVTCTIITRPATDAVGHIHDRTPLIIPPDMWSDWLDCAGGPSITELIAATPDPVLTPRQVSRAVGNVRNNDPSLLEPASG